MEDSCSVSGHSRLPRASVTENLTVTALRGSLTGADHATEPPTDTDDEDLVIVPKGENENMGEMDAILLNIFSYLVIAQELENMAQVSRKWKELVDQPSLYQSLQSVNSDGSINWVNLKNLGFKCKGTEGECFKCLERSTGKILVMKKAPVFPKGEGVPYHMIREVAILKGMNHDHVVAMEWVSLTENKLHIFFPYVDKTLYDMIYPTGDSEAGGALPDAVTRKILFQLLDAVAYCHRRGVTATSNQSICSPSHRIRKISAMQRCRSLTSRWFEQLESHAALTQRRWYRAPEILMGVDKYSSAVDMWAVGCIFAELAQGKPLFAGISEIDQLFQIFSKLSTPTSETWPDFTSLPNYHFEFPHWGCKTVTNLIPEISGVGVDLLTKLLAYNPVVGLAK